MDIEFHQLLTCPVCLDIFKQPKLLPCQHTFCLKPCLQNLVIDRTIRCPECRSVHALPRGGALTLPNNLTIIKFLDLKSYSKQSKTKSCQDCGSVSETRIPCNHCEKILCENCIAKHTHTVQQELKRSIVQVQKILPKVSETISDIETRLEKSKSNAKAIQAEIIQSVDRCIAELNSRKEMLIEEVDTLVAAEARSLQVERENLEVEFATMTSFCENVQDRAQVVTDAINSGSVNTIQEHQKDMQQMSRTSKEHIRSTRVAMGNAEDKISRSIKFRNEGERSLLCSISHFGELTMQQPSRLSLTFGSDLALNDAEIERVMHVEYSPRYGRRSSQHIDVSASVPNFHSPSSLESDPLAPTNGSNNSTPRSNAAQQRRRNRANRRNTTQHPSYLTVGNIGQSSPNDNRPLHVTGMRTVLWQYRSKERVKFYFGSKGSNIGSFNWPRGIAVTSSDHIVVSDSSNHRVQIFDEEGNPTIQFGSYGTGPGEFDCLAGICVTTQGWIITADRYNHRIQIFDSSGRFIRQFGEEGTGEGQLSYPWGVATDSMGFIYVCDKDNHRIQVFTLDGGFIRKFGRVGSYDAQFDTPQYLAVTNDNKIVVSDSGNHRIQIFDKYGRFLQKFGAEGSSEGYFKYPRGVVTDRHGNILVADSGNNRIQVFRSDGSFIAAFGNWGSDPGHMKGLEGIALKSNNEVVISDRENHRIQIF